MKTGRERARERSLMNKEKVVNFCPFCACATLRKTDLKNIRSIYTCQQITCGATFAIDHCEEEREHDA